MNRLEKVLYTAKAHTTGGRTGMSRSSDGRLEVRLSRPGSPGTGTNPEQLFAAGWSACFESAMEFAARSSRTSAPAAGVDRVFCHEVRRWVLQHICRGYASV